MRPPNFDLHESAWGRAKADAAGAYRSATFALCVGVLGLFASAVAGLVSFDGRDPKTSALALLAFGLATIAFGCLSVLVFQIGAAPLRQRNELRKAWPSQESIDPDLRLKDLHRRGRDLLAGLGAAAFTLDSDKVEDWTTEVVKWLGAHGSPEQTDSFLDSSADNGGTVSALTSRLETLNEIVDSRKRPRQDSRTS